MSDEAERLRREYDRRERTVGRRYRYTEPAHLFLVQGRERALLALLARHGVAERLGGVRALDVGCGSGDWLLDLLRYGATAERLAGVDLLAERVAAARSRLPHSDLRQADATALPFGDGAFDLVIQSMLLSGVLDGARRRRIAGELRRVTAPGGLIVWYDLARDNPRNPAVSGIDRRALAGLFPGCAIEARSLTLAAPLARLVAPRAPLAAALLERLPPLRSHLLAAIRPGPAARLDAAAAARV